MAKLKVVPVMGPGCGVKELERCPPVYHVELTAEQMREAINNPASLGLEGITNIILHTPQDRPQELAPQEEEQPAEVIGADGGGEAAQRLYCCIKCLSDSLC